MGDSLQGLLDGLDEDAKDGVIRCLLSTAMDYVGLALGEDDQTEESLLADAIQQASEGA